MEDQTQRIKSSTILLGFDHDSSIGITKVTSSISSPLPASASKEAIELAKKTFFGDSTSIAGVVGTVHPFLAKGKIHPSTSDALTSIIGRLDLCGVKRVPERELTATGLSGGAAILGGPVANLHARLLFGANGYSSLLGTRLPIVFDYASKLKESLYTGAERWSVVVKGVEFGGEFLIITSLPSGVHHRITNFAGVHGAGTRSIDHLLRSESLLHELYRRTSSLPGWQALVPVVTEDYEVPMSVGKLQVVEITGVDFDKQAEVIREQMILTGEKIAELMELLPYGRQVEFANTALRDTVVDFREERYRRLTTRKKCEKLYSVYSSSALQFEQSERSIPTSGAPGSAPQMGAQLGPPHRESHVRSVTTPPKENRPRTGGRRGRPPKKDRSNLKLSRLHLKLSTSDIERIERLVAYTEAPSMAEVVRVALREYERHLMRTR